MIKEGDQGEEQARDRIGTTTQVSCIHKKGSDKGHLGEKYGFLLLTPVGTSKGGARVTID